MNTNGKRRIQWRKRIIFLCFERDGMSYRIPFRNRNEMTHWIAEKWERVRMSKRVEGVK